MTACKNRETTYFEFRKKNRETYSGPLEGRAEPFVTAFLGLAFCLPFAQHLLRVRVYVCVYVCVYICACLSECAEDAARTRVSFAKSGWNAGLTLCATPASDGTTTSTATTTSRATTTSGATNTCVLWYEDMYV